MPEVQSSMFLRSILEIELEERGIRKETIDLIISSGYGGRQYIDTYSGPERNSAVSVSDCLYGSKGQSSKFEIDNFVAYAEGNHVFEKAPPFPTYTVSNKKELFDILSDSHRSKYLQQGSLSFRGQTSEYKLKRKLPNPFRMDELGEELSILPGLYRQPSPIYNFDDQISENFDFLNALALFDLNSHDPMRVQQHYANQTPGLDVTFDIDVALFFATNKFRTDAAGRAYFEKVDVGHAGVIYGFVFRDPKVLRSEFEIRRFDILKNKIPTRILRQACGLPLFSDCERNIAITDIDFVAYLSPNFDGESEYSAEYLFPGPSEDEFYGFALDIKNKIKSSSAARLMDTFIEYAF